MDSIFSELPRDLRFVIYEKAMHAAYKKYFSDQVLPEILRGIMPFWLFWRKLERKESCYGFWGCH
jgi:hypothetical protein